MIKKTACLTLLLVFVIMICGCAHGNLPNQSIAPDTLIVSFLDVGQGDSIFITYNNQSMLIDTGERDYSKRVIDYIEKQGFSRIDILVGTHPHSDHIGGMAEIIKTFEIGDILMPQVQHNTRTFEDTLDAIIKKGLSAKSPVPGDTFMLGAATVTVIAPYKIVNNNLNNDSIVLKVSYDGYDFLFMGDAESEEEADILAGEIDISANVIKIGHHGSYTSTGENFLEAVSLEIAVIMLGKGNSYGHPHNETLRKLTSIDAKIYRTDINGIITVKVCDGVLEITAEKNAVQQSYVVQPPDEKLSKAEEQFIGNTNSKKFHNSSCSSLPDEKNRIYFDTRDEAINHGYEPCKICKP